MEIYIFFNPEQLCNKNALSLLCIEADVLRKIGYEELIKDFARKKGGENYSTINEKEPYRNKFKKIGCAKQTDRLGIVPELQTN